MAISELRPARHFPRTSRATVRVEIVDDVRTAVKTLRETAGFRYHVLSKPKDSGTADVLIVGLPGRMDPAEELLSAAVRQGSRDDVRDGIQRLITGIRISKTDSSDDWIKQQYRRITRVNS